MHFVEKAEILRFARNDAILITPHFV